jgi:hypothetical protein
MADVIEFKPPVKSPTEQATDEAGRRLAEQLHHLQLHHPEAFDQFIHRYDYLMGKRRVDYARLDYLLGGFARAIVTGTGEDSGLFDELVGEKWGE